MSDLKLDILAIGVHPDDVELGCGASILKHIDLGYKVGILDLTQGELGTRGSAEIRLREAEDARLFAGVSVRENLGLADGFFEINKEAKLGIIKVIRKYRPSIVLGNATRDRHPDHGKASQLIYQACFLSGLKKVITKENGVDQYHHRPRKLLNYIQDFNLEPDIVVDITGYMDKKIDYVNCFKSQFYDPDSEEENTPISSFQFIEYLKSRAQSHGRHIGVEYGEGFTCESYVGINDLMTLL